MHVQVLITKDEVRLLTTITELRSQDSFGLLTSVSILHSSSSQTVKKLSHKLNSMYINYKYLQDHQPG